MPLKRCKRCKEEIFFYSGHQIYCNQCVKERWLEMEKDTKIRSRKNSLIIYHKNKNNLEWKKKKYESSRKAYLKKYKEDKNFNVSVRLRNLLNQTLKRYTKEGKIYSSKKYGINYLIILKHLKPFPKNLKNYHIDHIKPLCLFQFINSDGSTNLEEVKKAFAPKNLQWLTAKENIKKGGKF